MGGFEADAFAIKLIDERVLNIRDHRGTQFTSQHGLKNGLIIVMSTLQKHEVKDSWPLLNGRVFRLGHWGNFDVDDPYGRGEAAFRKSSKSINTGVNLIHLNSSRVP